MFKCMQLQHALDMIPISQEPQAKDQRVRSHQSSPSQTPKRVGCTVCCQCQHPLPCHDHQDLGRQGVRVGLEMVATHVVMQEGGPGGGSGPSLPGSPQRFGQSIGIGSNVLGYLTEKDVCRSKDLSLIKFVYIPSSAADFRAWKNTLLTRVAAIDTTGRDVVLSWLLESLVPRGRNHMNFSTVACCQDLTRIWDH